MIEEILASLPNAVRQVVGNSRWRPAAQVYQGLRRELAALAAREEAASRAKHGFNQTRRPPDEVARHQRVVARVLAGATQAAAAKAEGYSGDHVWAHILLQRAGMLGSRRPQGGGRPREMRAERVAVRLWRAGISPDVIAKRLHRSRSGIYLILRNRGVACRGWSEVAQVAARARWAPDRYMRPRSPAMVRYYERRGLDTPAKRAAAQARFRARCREHGKVAGRARWAGIPPAERRRQMRLLIPLRWPRCQTA